MDVPYSCITDTGDMKRNTINVTVQLMSAGGPVGDGAMRTRILGMSRDTEQAMGPGPYNILMGLDLVGPSDTQ